MTHKTRRTTLKMVRMVLPLSRLLMILAPAWPPAKEATAAGRIKYQSTWPMDAYPMKPVNEEKQTMKVDDAAAIFVGVLRT